MERHLKVNTALCDMLSTKPEAIEAYDSIKINCAMCMTTERTRRLLSQAKVKINMANMIEIPTDEDVKVVMINGGKKMTADFEAPKEPTVLLVNGGLVIEESEKKSLDQYKAVVINGGVLHPMSFDTSNFYINGGAMTYPDGAILILQGLELTDSFIRTAVPGATYFVQGMPGDMGHVGDDPKNAVSGVFKRTGLSALEPLDLEALKSKNIRFYTGWVTATEENAEVLMQLVEGHMGCTIIPRGYKLMEGGRLDMLAVRRFGKRIFVEGDLRIDGEDADALNAVEELQVMGSVCIADSIADVFFEKCRKYGELTVYKGEWMDISNEASTIDREMLEGFEDGATFHIANASVEISPDVTAELLSERIHEILLNNSALVIAQDLKNAIRKKVRNNNGHISIRGEEPAQEPEPEPEKSDIIETVINTAYYKL
ncbi:MAG: hypothetical protein ACOX6S_06430 [Clostridia bacterium]|jgi:hypothetical protein